MIPILLPQEVYENTFAYLSLGIKIKLKYLYNQRLHMRELSAKGL